MESARDRRHQNANQSWMVAAVFLGTLIVVMVIVLPRIFSGRGDSLPGNVNTTTVVTRTYVSAKLGVRFSYADQDLGQQILVEESGNTIYVYLEGTVRKDGQFVQVFSKEPSITLQQAIERRFLRGYDPAKCFIQPGTDINGSQPTTGLAAVIAYPISTNGDEWLMNADECPTGYSFTNGLSYFWTDQEASDKFVFFSIGQYYIPASSVGTSWHTTLRFDSGTVEAR